MQDKPSVKFLIEAVAATWVSNGQNEESFWENSADIDNAITDLIKKKEKK